MRFRRCWGLNAPVRRFVRRLLHYNTALSLVFLAPLVLLAGEVSDILENVTFLGSTTFWSIMTLTGVTGFLINISTFLQIKFTSPLTNTISGTAKAGVQTILGGMIFRNPISLMVSWPAENKNRGRRRAGRL